MPKIVITGANGFIGSQICNYFSAKKWHVVALVRNAKTYQNPTIQYVEYSLTSPIPESAIKDSDYLIHTAYIKSDSAHPDAVEQNISGTVALLEACRKYKLKKNIFISSLSSKSNAISNYGKQKFAIETYFSSRQDAIIRAGLVIGDGGLIKDIVNFIRTRHVVPIINRGRQPIQIVAVDDLIKCIENIIYRNLSGTYAVASPRIYYYKDIMLAISRKLGIKPIFIFVPFTILLYSIRIAQTINLPLSITEDNLLGLVKSEKTETKNDLQKLGVTLKTLNEILTDLNYYLR